MSNQTSEKRRVRFVDDPMRQLVAAFKALYPRRSCNIHIVGGLKKLGETYFPKNGSTPGIAISVDQHFVGVMDVLAHELAHVAVGPGKGHGKEFKAAYRKIYERYEAGVSRRGKPMTVKIP